MCKLMRCYCLLFILCFFLGRPFAKAQGPDGIAGDLKFKHFTSANGLSQRSVMAILQDKKGYLWFGTRDGLNKFDGYRFIVYRHKAGDPASLSNNNIHSILEDSHGNLWIGTQSGINRYNPETDNFTAYTQSDNRTVTDNTIRGMEQISSELLWAATDNGILQIHIKTGKVERIKKTGDASRSLSDDQIRFFMKARDGDIWICNTRYIDVYHPATKTFKHIDYPKKSSNTTHLNDLPTLFTDRKNTLWLGYEQGLAVYDPQTQRFADFEFNNQVAVPTAVRSICEDLSGNLWIGSYSGLYLLTAGHAALQHIVHDENNATSLSQNSIYKIIRDSRGDIWIGTWADGLNYYNKDDQAFKNIAFGTTSNKLNYRVVSGIAEDPAGNLWLGTEGGGLNFFNRKTGRFTYYKNEPGNKNSLSANNVKGVVTGRDGTVWVGMHDGGLNYFNPARPQSITQIDFPAGSPVPLRGYKVLTLHEDNKGNIWIGTLTGGLIFYDVHTKQLSKVDHEIKTVMSIAQTENPDLLLVGGNTGLETVNINTKAQNKIMIKEGALNVNCIFIDPFNNYWIGTEGDGMYRYDPEKNKTTAYGAREGLPNDIVYGILADEGGNIWISTNNGISRLETASNKIKNYDQADGLQGNEFNYGSFLKTRSGELFFGGTNGLTYFNPKDLQKNGFVPNIDITGIEVNNMPYARINDAMRQIKLQHNENNFSLDFTALSYMYPEKSEFAYKLEGIDKDWVYVGNQRKAVYTNIPAGNYIFKVKGSNGDGVWNEQGDLIKIRILPAPWRTWWAYTLYVALCTGIFLYIRKLILLRTKERREKERIKEINQLKLNLFTEVSHDFRTPLTLIAGPLKEMIDKNMGDPYIRQQHDMMYRNAGMLLQLVNEVLDFAKIESDALSLRAVQDDIVPFVEDIKESFDELAGKRRIRYRFAGNAEPLPVWFDRVQLRKVLFNLLSNAFKFTEEDGEITVTVSPIAAGIDAAPFDGISISIINSGALLSDEQAGRIFDPFYQLEHKSKSLGSGIGLSLVKKLVELHKGVIQVKSSENEGTRFTVLLRSGSTHLSETERTGETHLAEVPLYLNKDLPAAPPPVEETDEPAGNGEENGQPTLLIVEDNPDVLHFIRQLFTGSYNILRAGNGAEAITLAQQKPVDLIISDVQMPVMDGFELCRQIKTNLVTSHISVILLTAKTSPTHQQKGYHIGADAYITKPFDATILKLRIDNVLKTRANLILKFKKDTILEPKQLTLTSPDEVFLGKAIEVVEQNIDNADFNANMFIAQMYMSRTVLYTKLKALTGQNITTFIRTIRLKKAGVLMVQSQMTIAQIAYEVGFNDLKYFRECFKEFFKLTPSEYKKQHTGGKAAS